MGFGEGDNMGRQGKESCLNSIPQQDGPHQCSMSPAVTDTLGRRDGQSFLWTTACSFLAFCQQFLWIPTHVYCSSLTSLSVRFWWCSAQSWMRYTKYGQVSDLGKKVYYFPAWAKVVLPCDFTRLCSRPLMYAILADCKLIFNDLLPRTVRQTISAQLCPSSHEASLLQMALDVFL